MTGVLLLDITGICFLYACRIFCMHNDIGFSFTKGYRPYAITFPFWRMKDDLYPAYEFVSLHFLFHRGKTRKQHKGVLGG